MIASCPTCSECNVPVSAVLAYWIGLGVGRNWSSRHALPLPPSLAYIRSIARSMPRRAVCLYGEERSGLATRARAQMPHHTHRSQFPIARGFFHLPRGNTRGKPGTCLRDKSTPPPPRKVVWIRNCPATSSPSGFEYWAARRCAELG